ncbi:MAG: isocitrate lyase/PEP mutase family protein [Rhodoplanes sp.]|uniref:isocitrate lyase/PEP mutase family protein n=1 Tax=Rhodoplanes sp. TaxID=1968906 RepID=UPI0017CA08BD|nr:isocitrate lyase/PEP mutase family protein [Rhodoplanes sp.]NVO16513.1 isocitrate lyase/PEP mutase family protein [Rhodoplanes sp.]
MTTLREKLQQRPAGTVLIAPGVYDMLSARFADRIGFDVLYMTGFGTVASHLGLPDAGLASYRDMVDRVATMAGGTTTPLVADGDTGYGGLLNVQHTVRGYEKAGAAAIQLEDQEYPKKCGHTPGRRVVPAEDMVEKIKVAVESRSSPEFLIVARTDARTPLGLDEAIRRGALYLDAGADILFVESPETEAEMAAIGKAFAGKPLLANMVEGGRTPVLPPAALARLGYAMAIYPVSGLLAAASAIDTAYRELKRNGTTLAIKDRLYAFDQLTRVVGFEAVWEFDRRHARKG